MRLGFSRQRYVADCLEGDGIKVELPEEGKED